MHYVARTMAVPGSVFSRFGPLEGDVDSVVANGVMNGVGDGLVLVGSVNGGSDLVIDRFARVLSPMEALGVEIAIIKAREPGERDRAFIERDGRTEQAAVHVVHDLPHLAVESLFEINGLWSELAGGRHLDANRSTTARDPKRRKQGHIIGAGIQGATTEKWLTADHRCAKVATNAVVNRAGDGPDTARGVRSRLAAAHDAAAAALLARLDDAGLTVRGASLGYSAPYLPTLREPVSSLRQ